MFTTDIGWFCAKHEDWAEVLVEEPYYLKIKEDGLYVMFSYDQIRADFSYSIVKEARGIIFRKGEWETPVCWAFDKFGNYGESYVPNINWDTAFVTEKIDGSLIKIWFDDNWHISTNGTIDAFKAELGDVRMPSFGDYFIEALGNYYNNFGAFISDLNKQYTYMFELVGPYNRVVIPYDEPDLYFLGARNKFTGDEFLPLVEDMYHLGVSKFKRPALYSLTSLEDCIKAAELKSWDDEGFVVCDKDFNRVKVKSPSYVLAHYARNNNVINKKHLIRVVLANEVEEFICYASDYKDVLEEVQKQINLFVNIGDKLAEACRAISDKLSRPDYARLVKAMPDMYHGLLFCNYGGCTDMKAYTTNWSENKWEENLERFEKYKERNWESF